MKLDVDAYLGLTSGSSSNNDSASVGGQQAERPSSNRWSPVNVTYLVAENQESQSYGEETRSSDSGIIGFDEES